MKAFIMALALCSVVIYVGLVTGAFVNKEVLPALQTMFQVKL